MDKPKAIREFSTPELIVVIVGVIFIVIFVAKLVRESRAAHAALEEARVDMIKEGYNE